MFNHYKTITTNPILNYNIYNWHFSMCKVQIEALIPLKGSNPSVEGPFATIAVTPTFTSEMVLRGTSRHSTTLPLGHVGVRAMLRHRSHVRTTDHKKGWDSAPEPLTTLWYHLKGIEIKATKYVEFFNYFGSMQYLHQVWIHSMPQDPNHM